VPVCSLTLHLTSSAFLSPLLKLIPVTSQSQRNFYYPFTFVTCQFIKVPLVAATLALEGVLIGTGQFAWLASSMLVSTTLAAWLLTHASMVSEAFTGTTAAGVAGATAVAVAASAATTAGCISSGAVDLWRGGLSALFGLRFLAAALRLMDQTRGPLWSQEEKKAAARYRANPFF